MLTNSMNMRIWIVGTVNQLLIIVSYTEIKSSKNEVVSGKSPFFVISPFCTPCLTYRNIGFWQDSFVWKCCAFILSTLKWKWYSWLLRKVLVFQKNLFQNLVVKNVQNLQWLLHKNMPSLKRKANFKNPWHRFFQKNPRNTRSFYWL